MAHCYLRQHHNLYCIFFVLLITNTKVALVWAFLSYTLDKLSETTGFHLKIV